MIRTLKEWQDSIEPIDNFRNYELRESMRKKYYNCISYDDFKILLENLLKKYDTVITDYSIDINNNIYIRCDLEIDKKEELKNFYTEFRNLLKTEHYYIMGYTINGVDGYKEDITLDMLLNNRIIRLFLDKVYDIPIEIDELPKLYGKTFLYHVTYKDVYYNSIIGSGLMPSKQEMVSHEPDGKVYFFINKLDCHDFINEKRKHNLKNENVFNDEYFYFLNNHKKRLEKLNIENEYKKIFETISYDKFVILRIDIKTAGNIKIYKDRKELFRDAYYTYDNIPQWSIILDEDNL